MFSGGKMRILLLGLILFGLMGCSDGGKFELTRRETEKLSDEVVAAWALLSKTPKIPANLQEAYLKLDMALLKYPNADPELIALAKDSRESLKATFDLAKQAEWSTENIVNAMLYTVNTFIGQGETLLDANKKFYADKKQIFENVNKLSLQVKPLSEKLCKKYQVSCKVDEPAKNKKEEK